jgi:enoyl-CoA hydratase/carnithine racemase
VASTLQITLADGMMILRIQREHGNAINGAVVAELMAACQEAESDPQVRGVLLTADGKLFSPGLDLRELYGLDRAEMHEFVSHFNACILSLYTFSKPLVAGLQGHAIAGGCVISLTADRRILENHALIGLNELKVGVAFPFGVAMILRDVVSRSKLEEVVLLGKNYRGPDALAVGLVHEVHAREGFEEFCLKRLSEFSEKGAQAFAITKRYLRSATTERIRANDSQFIGDFLDSWFAKETRERMVEVLDNLGGDAS